MSSQEQKIFTFEKIKDVLYSQIKKEGLLKRVPKETMEELTSINRSFRIVQFTSERGNVYISLVDEQLSEYASKFEECLLLWRPKYSDIEGNGKVEEPSSELTKKQEQDIGNIIRTITEKRKISGENLIVIDPSIKKMHSSLRGSLSFLLPTAPSSLRQDEKEQVKWREERAIFLAASLVTNCPVSEEIKKVELMGRTLVRTHIGIYADTESGRKRIVAIETTKAKDMKAAMRNGSALGRFFDISEISPDILTL